MTRPYTRSFAACKQSLDFKADFATNGLYLVKQARSNPFITNYADFVSGLVSALKGGGNVFRKLEAPLYPYRDAHAYDLNCLGADMYAAILSHSMPETANARRTRSGDTSLQGTQERKNGHDAAEHTSSGP